MKTCNGSQCATPTGARSGRPLRPHTRLLGTLAAALTLALAGCATSPAVDHAGGQVDTPGGSTNLPSGAPTTPMPIPPGPAPITTFPKPRDIAAADRALRAAGAVPGVSKADWAPFVDTPTIIATVPAGTGEQELARIMTELVRARDASDLSWSELGLEAHLGSSEIKLGNASHLTGAAAKARSTARALLAVDRMPGMRRAHWDSDQYGLRGSVSVDGDRYAGLLRVADLVRPEHAVQSLTMTVGPPSSLGELPETGKSHTFYVDPTPAQRRVLAGVKALERPGDTVMMTMQRGTTMVTVLAKGKALPEHLRWRSLVPVEPRNARPEDAQLIVRGTDLTIMGGGTRGEQAAAIGTRLLGLGRVPGVAPPSTLESPVRISSDLSEINTSGIDLAKAVPMLVQARQADPVWRTHDTRLTGWATEASGRTCPYNETLPRTVSKPVVTCPPIM